MAPTVGRAENGAVLSLGSPGADRITSALHQTIINFVNAGMPLELAVSHPRIHVERDERGIRASYERGVQTGGLDIPVREFEDLHMYFGGVAAALFSPGEGFVLASDPRRDGGTAVGGSGAAS
jgi:gamma-glutamyltranspeptidase/glutathione hydrolase